MNLLKNLNVGGLMVLVLGVVLMVSWNSHDTKKVAPEWYQVSLIDEEEDADDLSNQKIDGPYGGTPTGACNTFPGVICAIELDLDENDPIPATVHEADSLGLDISVTRQRQN